MVKASISSTLAPQPSWFTAKRLLAIFCIINLLNYVDRGAIASNGVNGKRNECTKSDTCSSGSGIQGDFNLSNFQDGVISSAFMVGLLLASPIFASLAKSVNPFRLIGVGLAVWTFATAGCGLSINFWSITLCRMLVGVGEASFISLAAPFIDDNAPVDQKTAWLGIFYMCIPTGIAVGYVYGGLVGSLLNWRWAFWIEALLMLPFAILGFVMKPLQLKGFLHTGSKRPLTSVHTGSKRPLTSVQTSCTEAVASPSQDGSFQTRNDSKDDSKSAPTILNQLTKFWKDIKVLLLEKVYFVNIIGYIAYNFVIGAYSYWGPKAGYYIYHMNNADLMFGGITIVCGIFGTLAGGFVLDQMTSTISNAFKLLSVATFFGAIFCFAAFCFRSLYAFIALFALGELLVFATQGPVNYVCLHCVKPSMRPLSMAMSTVSIHLFGDVPSSPLVGVLQVTTGILFHIFCLFFPIPFSYQHFRRTPAADIDPLFLKVVLSSQAPCATNHGQLEKLKSYHLDSLQLVWMLIFRVILMKKSIWSNHLVLLLRGSLVALYVDCDHINNWRVTALILTSVLFLASGIWVIGIFLHSVDRFNEENELQVSVDDRSNTIPLLGETTQSL